MKIEGNKITIESGEWVKITLPEEPDITEYECDGPLVLMVYQQPNEGEEA